VTKILNRFENRIRIDGAVFRPNTTPFMKACAFDLIAKAEGLKEDAYSKRARIIRVKSDLTTEIVTVDLEQAFKRRPRG
jgi:protein involved in polysaccharide export with SLBB domain